MRLGFWHYPVWTLGPGERFGLWLQGCTRDCPGCMSPELQNPNVGLQLPVEELFQIIFNTITNEDCGGVTLSGGEPFEQPEELEKLCTRLHSSGLTDILVYSGFSAQYLLNHFPWIKNLLACLIDNPFLADQPTDLIWKGSANQNALIFNHSELYAPWLEKKKSSLQIAKFTYGLRVIGIPQIGDAEKLRELIT